MGEADLCGNFPQQRETVNSNLFKRIRLLEKLRQETRQLHVLTKI